MARFQVAGDLINRVAVSVGLTREVDPFSSADPAFIQLVELTNQVGETLIGKFPWEILERIKSFTTGPADSGLYELPEDFAYMIDQTGWQMGAPGAAYPLLGPASPQMWSYLVASQLYNVTIYAWFQVSANKFQLWPQPPPPNIPISYRYISRNWVIDGQSPPQDFNFKQSVSNYADVVEYEPMLFISALKLSFLQAKGFDTTKAQEDYDLSFDTWTGYNKPSPVLSTVNSGPALWRPLDSLVNVPQTGFGF